jgi:hypothetical protein
MIDGRLTGNGGSANCRVTIDADHAPYIRDVIPPLPEGEYQLSVNGLTFNVRHVRGEWVQSSVDDNM